MKHYLIGLDTETCNTITKPDGSLDMSQALVYDIGWQVTDRQGNVYLERSFIIYEVFCQMPNKMQTAYYANKIPQYQADINAGTRKIAKFDTVNRIFRQDCKQYSPEAVFAHNASFDLNALNHTYEYLTGGQKKFFFPKNLAIWDTMKMANSVIAPMKSYIKFCENNGLMTKHKIPRPRVTAEALFRFISHDVTFNESHTGLEDVKIETMILVYCFKKHQKMNKLLAYT